MEKSHIDERRKYRRIETDQVISFAPVEARDLFGVGRNMSPGGIRFEAIGCEINLEDVLRVTFNVGDHTVVAVGRVTWATEMDHPPDRSQSLESSKHGFRMTIWNTEIDHPPDSENNGAHFSH